ncbi:DUF2147 domain-containing protein [Enterovirga rhinocerotis]|uniref:Uncharacterized protein (DUF2147 family) n=1 Tax=Enterovirga rhinocerotis TaxID=1339210 RepID=A0A4R7C8H4_9HYPH|nr:DUF2147 domain-containing protein [Enterovirga rhinocerotis]TDR94272.1 uncharacterized protein (DUF2147 family) [Enterovirga rhinocerotis]
MTKRRSVLVIAGMLAASTATAAGIEGTWMRGDGNARVLIAPCGDKVCASNLWVKDTSSGEAVGDRLVMTLSRGADGTFSGFAFDQKRNLSYSITIRASDGALQSRGCILGKMVCRDVSWRAIR